MTQESSNETFGLKVNFIWRDFELGGFEDFKLVVPTCFDRTDEACIESSHYGARGTESTSCLASYVYEMILSDSSLTK